MKPKQTYQIKSNQLKPTKINQTETKKKTKKKTQNKTKQNSPTKPNQTKPNKTKPNQIHLPSTKFLSPVGLARLAGQDLQTGQLDVVYCCTAAGGGQLQHGLIV